MKLSAFKITLDTASRRHRDDNGFLIVENNPIAKSGVFDYAGQELGAADKSRMYKVYRSFGELQKSKDLFKGKPLLLNHEWVEPDDMPKVRGAIGGNIEEKEPYLYADLIIYDERLIEQIESGNTVELSPGYLAKYEEGKGEFNGESYDYVQKDLKFNHLAVVPTGRSGEDLRVLDAKYSKGERCMSVKTKDLADISIGNGNSLTETQDEDKRKIMSEIEGMIKDKVDEEVWRTIAGKLEKLSYEGSEESKSDDADPDDSDEKPSKDGNTAEELKAAFNELKSKLDVFLNQEAAEPAHQSEDKTCDEDDKEDKEDMKDDKRAMDGKYLKVGDMAAIKTAIESGYARVMDAYSAVKPYTGEFNLYAKGRLATEAEVYKYGLRCLNDGREIKVSDAKSAFLGFVEAKSVSAQIPTQDSSTSNDDLQKLTLHIL